MRKSTASLLASISAILLFLAGCNGPKRILYPEPIPLADAARLVNANASIVSGTLRAVGPVDGRFTEDGTIRSFHADGVMFFRPPQCFRMDFKVLGERQLLLGSNEEAYWVYLKKGDQYFCGRHGEPVDPEESPPIQPDRIIDALGLSPIELWPDDPLLGCVQRVVEPYQQILFIERDEWGRIALQKEYWLDLAAPGRVRRVVFRDALGRVQIESRLDDYKRMEDGPWLPTKLEVRWFDQANEPNELRFTVRLWSLYGDIDCGSVQFAAPPACLPRTTPISPDQPGPESRTDAGGQRRGT
ncbi:MAG: hypothetical protein J5J06_11340 [Phycisphaerae bacterium]|nr:hypothetical protein [Phycisphaerae bacterium]